MSRPPDQNTSAPPIETPKDDDLYKIGTVAKLTGIAVERLRAWERRYGLTPASREGKTRYFSGAQVERLTRIKRLIDQGHPVSTLINLDEDTLNERLQLTVEQKKARHDESQIGQSGYSESPLIRVGLIGTQLLMLEQTLTETPRIDVLSRWVNLSVALAELAQRNPATVSKTASVPPHIPEVVVVLLGSVTPESLDELNELPEKMLPVVVYHYATESGLAAASEREMQLLRWPARWSEIEQAVARQAKSPMRAGRVTPRRFSDEQLLSIASASTSTSFGCACPADLVNLISALNAFSDHSEACSTSYPTSRKTDSLLPPDRARATPGRAQAKRFEPQTSAATAQPGEVRQALLRHAQIAQRTSEARLELERVLEDWVLAEELLPVPN